MIKKIIFTLVLLSSTAVNSVSAQTTVPVKGAWSKASVKVYCSLSYLVKGTDCKTTVSSAKKLAPQSNPLKQNNTIVGGIGASTTTAPKSNQQKSVSNVVVNKVIEYINTTGAQGPRGEQGLVGPQGLQGAPGQTVFGGGGTTVITSPVLGGSGLTITNSTFTGGSISGSTLSNINFSNLPSIPLTPGAILVGSASSTAAELVVGTAGQVLMVNASGTPAWSTIGAINASNTTNVVATTTNTFQTIVNGVSSAITNLINSFTQSLSGNTLTTTINGVTATSSVISNNTVSSAGNIITTNVNGVTSTSTAVNSNTLSTSGVILSSTINGVVATTSLAGLIASDNFFTADLVANSSRFHDFAGFDLDLTNTGSFNFKANNSGYIGAGGPGFGSGYLMDGSSNSIIAGSLISGFNTELRTDTNGLEFYSTNQNSGEQTLLYSNKNNFGYRNVFSGFNLFDVNANSGQVTLGSYPSNRNDPSINALLTPNNFLYTGNAGELLSAPLSSIILPTTNILDFSTTTGLLSSNVNGILATSSLSNIISPITVQNVSSLFATGLLSPAGVGSSALNANFFGENAGSGATFADNSNFFGTGAGQDALNAGGSNFFGIRSGYQATNANSSNFFGESAGLNATNAFQSNFFGVYAGDGSTDAFQSNFFGFAAGESSPNAFQSNFFGTNAGGNAANAKNSIFIGGFGAGTSATNANNSIFLGNNAGNNDTVNNSTGGTSILIGDFTNTGGFSNSIALGKSAVNTKTNQFLVGSAYSDFSFRGVNYTFPSAQGATGTVLANNGLGGLSWITGGVGTTTNLLNFSTSTNILSSNVNGILATSSLASLLSPITVQNTNSLFSTGLINPAGVGAINATDSNFFGANAGNGATFAEESNFFGSNAGNGATFAEESNFFGIAAGQNAILARRANFFGNSAGDGATSAFDSNFFGSGAGVSAINANASNFFGNEAGRGATNAFSSNFFGTGAGFGATNANSSNFFGLNAGSGATDAFSSNFFGDNAGVSAINADNSIFMGKFAGAGAVAARNSIFLGQESGNNDSVNNGAADSSILIGDFTSTGGFSNSIALGRGAINTATNQFLVGPAYSDFSFRGVNYTFPSVQGGAGTTLINDGTGVLSWATGGSSISSSTIASNLGFIQNGNSFGANGVLGTNDNFDQIFKTNNVERLRINSAGNVAIGTTTATTKLEVAGEIKATGLLGGFTSLDRGNNSSRVISYLLNDIFRFDDYGVKSLLTMNRISGNVGIGTSAPSELLTVGNLTPFAVSNTGFAFAQGGTGSTPSYSFFGDRDTGMYSPSANSLRFTAGGNSIFRMDATGIVINDISGAPTAMMQIAGGVASSTFRMSNAISGGTLTDGFLTNFNGSDVDFTNLEGGKFNFSGNGLSAASTNTGLTGNFTSLSSASVAPSFNMLSMQMTGVDNASASQQWISFVDSTGTTEGAVRGTGAGGVSFFNASDRRLKENIVSGSYGLSDLLKVNPVSYTYSGSTITQNGFIAQDLYEVYSDAVSVGTDEINDSGKLKTPWGVDYGKLTPLLVKSLQDLNQKIETGFAPVSLATTSDVTATDTFITSVITETPRIALDYIKTQMNTGKRAVNDFVANRVTALNGYFENIFAKKIRTEQICVKKSDNTEICLNGDQLQNIVDANPAAQSGSGQTGSTAGGQIDSGPQSGNTGTPGTETGGSTEQTPDTLPQIEPTPEPLANEPAPEAP